MRFFLLVLVLVASCAPRHQYRKFHADDDSSNQATRFPSSCSSDYECGPNQVCASEDSQALGNCMNAVNEYNQTDYDYNQSFGVKKAIKCTYPGCD